MDYLRIGDVPPLRDPVLLLAFAGWSDAGQAATGAARFLVNAWSATRLGDIDPEEFYNFADQRPQVKLSDGMMRTIEWPENAISYHVSPGPRDFVVLIGVEPHLRWRAFTATIGELVERCGIKLAFTLGGLLADVPHSRPVRVTGSSTDELFQARIEQVAAVSGSRYEGPTGITGVLGDKFRRLALPSASMWANVPHYINAAANPKAMAALLERLDALFDLNLDLAELRESAVQFDREVTEAVSGDADAAAYVHQLEEQADAQEVSEQRPQLPSGDVVVRELEEFLRRTRDDEPTDERG